MRSPPATPRRSAATASRFFSESPPSGLSPPPAPSPPGAPLPPPPCGLLSAAALAAWQNSSLEGGWVGLSVGEQGTIAHGRGVSCARRERRHVSRAGAPAASAASASSSFSSAAAPRRADVAACQPQQPREHVVRGHVREACGREGGGAEALEYVTEIVQIERAAYPRLGLLV